MEASKLQIDYRDLFFKISSFPEETAKQLLEYVDFLWEKHTPAENGLSDIDKNELDRRVKKYFQNPESGLSLDQVISGLEQSLGENLR
ncbi:MAG: addiction module protein [Leptospiraceae bacterium]|nr:addiction module protein [Leptospiraceae bacterium]